MEAQPVMLGLVVVIATALTVVGVLMLMSALERRGRRAPGIDGLGGNRIDAVFLFEDGTLVDANERAETLLSTLRAAGPEKPPWQALRHHLQAAFPDLERQLARLPERGRIGIFNRSYYEEVLVVRVHPQILHSQGLPEGVIARQAIWEERYRSMVDFEAHLHRNGTRIIKFFLHLSKDEQRKRFQARIDEPDKNWKFSLADVRERKRWDDYMNAYEACLGATSTAYAPWYVVPADNKKNARMIISQIILDSMKALGMSYPTVSESRLKELQAIREEL